MTLTAEVELIVKNTFDPAFGRVWGFIEKLRAMDADVVVDLIVEYDFDTVPVVFERHWDVVEILWMMAIEVLVEVVHVKARTGRSSLASHNDTLDARASSSEPGDRSSGHFYIDWPPVACQCAA
jgi:hypothetical protein